MAVSRVKTWVAAETLTASDLNAEFNNILNNGEDLAWPATKAKDLNGFELILDADADTSITADTDDQIDVRIAGVDVGHWISTGLMVAVGTSLAPDGTLHVHTATAGSVTASTSADDLVVENSGPGGITILTPDASVGRLHFGTVSNNSNVIFNADYNSGSQFLSIDVGASERFRIGHAGAIFINESVNTNMTTGLTINQGTSDDEILALKSGDVGHSFTGIAEADTYGTFAKAVGVGGLDISGLSSDATNAVALQLNGLIPDGGVNDVSTTAAVAIVEVTAVVDDDSTGSEGLGAAGVAGNLFAVKDAALTQFIVKEDGAILSNAAHSTYDEYDDVDLVRAFSTVTAPHDVIKDKWDSFVKNNEATLVELGILGAPLDQNPLYSVTKLQMLHNGAIWQTHTRLMDMLERLELAETKLAALPAS